MLSQDVVVQVAIGVDEVPDRAVHALCQGRVPRLHQAHLGDAEDLGHGDVATRLAGLVEGGAELTTHLRAESGLESGDATAVASREVCLLCAREDLPAEGKSVSIGVSVGVSVGVGVSMGIDPIMDSLTYR